MARNHVVRSVALVSGLFIGIVAAHTLAAAAQPGTGCRTFEKKIQSKENASTSTHTGVKTSMKFGSASNPCVRVSTIGVISVNETGFVEWGWVLGYSGTPCGDSYHTTPTLFFSWQNSGGTINCRVHFGNTPDFFTVEVSDVNENNWWNYYKAGTEIGQVNMVFHKGNLFMLTERNSSNDSGFGAFHALNKTVEGGGGGFSNFTNPALWFDQDDGYKWCKKSNTAVEHIDNAATC